MPSAVGTPHPIAPPLRVGVVRGISYGLFAPPDEFLEAARDLGAGLIRAYLYWSQVEPEPGAFNWDVVDSLLEQFDGDEELWITVCSSSRWGTREVTDFLPPSPAHDVEAYGRFIRRVVERCAGRVRFWQCDNEPSNTTLLWAGTAEEYVAQLGVFAREVRRADPHSLVVLGGCGYDVLSSPPDGAPRQFFDHVLTHGAGSFDAFSVNLYGEPARLPGYLAGVRSLLGAHGCRCPVVVGELNGPVLFEFPEVEPVLFATMAEAFAMAPATQSTDELVAGVGAETPESRAMHALYERRDELPEQLQMFLAGCSPELEAKRHRIACRGLVVRMVVALADGIHRVACWNLAPEVPDYHNPFQLMHLMFGKLILLDYEGTKLVHRYPTADTFALLADQLGGAESAELVPVDGRPAVRAYVIERRDRPPLVVAWHEVDQFSGEDRPPVAVELPWPAGTARAIDAFGVDHRVVVESGTVRLELGVTPVLITGGRAG